MKKRLLMAVLMLCMVFAFAACGNNNAGNTDNEGTNNEQNANDDANNDANQDNNDDASDDANDGKITYTVIVVDEDGNPIAGAMVQVCDEGNCFAPTTTNAEGVAEFRLEQTNEYKTKLLTNPEGYEAVDTDYVHFDDKTEVTLTVKPVA